MNILGEVLEERADRRTSTDEADDLWLRERAGIDPEERRKSWRRWLRKELEKTLQWPSDQAAKERLVGQCAAELTTLARQLRGRGWLLEGAALAEHVRALLGPIAKAQRAGRIKDFWPYFGEAVARYVGANAEEIQAHARRTGADEGAQTMAGAMAALGLGRLRQTGPSLTEIIAAKPIAARPEPRKDAAEDGNQTSLAGF